MAYPNARYEVTVVQGVDLNSAADAGDWAPGAVPHIIRGVYLLIDNDIGATGEVRIDKRVTFGSDTGRGDGDIAIINLLTTHTGGKVVYKDGLNVKVSPGEQAMVQVSNVTAASDTCDVVFDVERVPEVPGNNTAQVVTT